MISVDGSIHIFDTLGSNSLAGIGVLMLDFYYDYVTNKAG